jgi:hypothetical protein
MGDSSRQKSGPRTSSRGSNNSQNNASSLNPRGFAPRADLEAQIAASPSPVTSAKDARSWLESKGWLLNTEENSKLKFADILLSATLSFKLPAEASTAIRAVALLLRDHADEEFSSTVSDSIIDKVIDKLIEPVDKLNNSVIAAKDFLDATTQKQASELLSLQESIKQHADLVKSFTESSEKFAQSSIPRGRADAAWPPLSGVNPPVSTQGHPAPSPLRGGSQPDPRVAQRVALATKQLLIEYGPLDEGEEPRPRSVEAQREMRQLFNGWNDSVEPTETAEGQPPPAPSRAVRNVSIFDRPAMLLEFDSAESKIKFANMIDKNDFLLNEISPKARVCPWTYAVIFRFVPCTGSFDPSLGEHLRNIERENDLPVNSIAAASWCKRPDRRSPNQTTATLKVTCFNPDIANRLLTGRIRVDDHLINARKDIRIPIRCVKCQGYGHTQDSCIRLERCANCASEFHRADKCDRQPCCVACGPGSQHPSTSPACPAFMQKCDALDGRFPENAMPYFPSNDSWTWATAPSNPPPPDIPLPPPQQANPRHRSIRPIRQQPRRTEGRRNSVSSPPPHSQQARPRDNGWPSERRRQTTLTGAWGSQPITASSSNARPEQSLPPSTQ